MHSWRQEVLVRTHSFGRRHRELWLSLWAPDEAVKAVRTVRKRYADGVPRYEADVLMLALLSTAREKEGSAFVDMLFPPK